MQGNTEKYKEIQRYTRKYREIQGHTEIYMEMQRYTRTYNKKHWEDNDHASKFVLGPSQSLSVRRLHSL